MLLSIAGRKDYKKKKRKKTYRKIEKLTHITSFSSNILRILSSSTAVLRLWRNIKNINQSVVVPETKWTQHSAPKTNYTNIWHLSCIKSYCYKNDKNEKTLLNQNICSSVIWSLPRIKEVLKQYYLGAKHTCEDQQYVLFTDTVIVRFKSATCMEKVPDIAQDTIRKMIAADSKDRIPNYLFSLIWWLISSTWMPSGKFMEESINTASWLKLISNLQRFGAT